METLTNAPTDNHQLVLSLIKDDLVNSKLINSLIGMGIDATNYSLNLRNVILKLMGFKTVNDQTHEKYFDFTLRSQDIDFVANPGLLNPLVQEIFNFLDGLDRKAVQTDKPFISNKAVMIDLIKQDLINYKLIDSLRDIQINAEDYTLDIGRIVFEIMDVEEREDVDEIFEKYIEMSKPILVMYAVQSNKEIDVLAAKIYDYLEKCSQQK